MRQNMLRQKRLRRQRILLFVAVVLLILGSLGLLLLVVSNQSPPVGEIRATGVLGQEFLVGNLILRAERDEIASLTLDGREIQEAEVPLFMTINEGGNVTIMGRVGQELLGLCVDVIAPYVFITGGPMEITGERYELPQIGLPVGYYCAKDGFPLSQI